MTISTGPRRIAAAAILLTVGALLGRVAWVAACGPFLTDIEAVATSVHPVNLETYRRGELGIVRQRLARRYLVQAYRVLNGKPPLANLVPRPAAIAADSSSAGQELSGYQQWSEALKRFAATIKHPPYFNTSRINAATYQWFVNCTDDALRVAARTLAARRERFGPDSTAVREWAQAQVDVFANCSGDALVLPAAPAGTDPLLRADYEYQVAAAYFYATQYEEAARRFRRIATDAQSPWQPYGRYLAARATIRQATVPDHDLARRDELLRGAATQLQDVLRDGRAAALHASARGLIGFIDARVRQFESLQTLSHELADAATVSDQQIDDYRRLMDRLIGDTVEYSYESVPHAPQVAATHDLNDWILATQGGGDAGLARALARWRETRSPLWLVSVLWNLPADDAAASDVLAAAAAIERSSPAYATVAFLRIRLLLELGRRSEARSLLAALPRRPEPGLDAEAINLLNAARFRAADTLDELLDAAPRLPLDPASTAPVFDDDAGQTFTRRLPLTWLVQAAERPALPARLRARVAGAAFTRALFLERGDEADRAARILAAVAPAARADLDSYLAATRAVDKRRLGVLLLLRTPGLHAHVRGIDDNVSYALEEPSRRFDHMFRRNWWCRADISPPDDQMSSPGGSGLLGVLYPDGRWLYPSFLEDSERQAAVDELNALSRIGSPQGYLADQAVAWARETPDDLRAAEALALAVEGGRWTCSVSARSRLAFQTLHRLFPQSEWAKRTKYWYAGWPEW